MKAVRNTTYLRTSRYDELEWIGPYHWENKIRVIWLRHDWAYKIVNGKPFVRERITPFVLARRRSKSGEGYVWVAGDTTDAKLRKGVRDAAAAIKKIDAADQARRLGVGVGGKRVDPSTATDPALRTWTDASGKFTITAELLDY